MFSFIKKIWTYIYCRGKFYHRRHGEQMLLGGLMACVLIATMALKSTGMDSMSLSAFTTAGDITVAQEYALSRAESVRALKYDYLSSVPLRAIDGSNGFYEEIDVSDSEISTGVSGGVYTCPSKSIVIKIYKGNGEDRKLCTTVKFNRVDPTAFESEINMVTNDSSSDSLYKAMSADAFRDLVDGKVTNDKNSEADDLVLSAKSLKEYVEDKLVSYAKNEDSVWFDAGAAVGSDYQGVYVEGYGKVLPTNVVYRGNVTNASDCLVVVPFVDSSNVWHYDYIKRSDLYNRFIDQLYFTFTINQSPNQTITVTTSDGVRHTSSFTVKYGTTWTASIAANSGYKPGTLSATSGTVRGNTSISATAAVPSKPPYTEKSWTTPGTYTWTCPAGVTRIRVAVCGGGGGGSAGMLNGGDYTAKLRVENGSASSFDDIVYATGGGGSYVDPSNDDEEPYCEIYSAGYPNGHSGNKIIMVNTMNGGNHRAVGGQGFAISFIGDSGNWGKGGDAYGSFYKYNHIDWLISGSSGGYNSGYINIQENKVYAVKVGSGGVGRFKKCATISSGWSVVGENGNSGFVLIAYGGDI